MFSLFSKKEKNLTNSTTTIQTIKINNSPIWKASWNHSATLLAVAGRPIEMESGLWVSPIVVYAVLGTNAEKEVSLREYDLDRFIHDIDGSLSINPFHPLQNPDFNPDVFSAYIAAQQQLGGQQNNNNYNNTNNNNINALHEHHSGVQPQLSLVPGSGQWSGLNTPAQKDWITSGHNEVFSPISQTTLNTQGRDSFMKSGNPTFSPVNIGLYTSSQHPSNTPSKETSLAASLALQKTLLRSHGLALGPSTILHPVPFRICFGHVSDITSLAWAPNSNLLLSSSIDTQCLLWNLEVDSSIFNLPTDDDDETPFHQLPPPPPHSPLNVELLSGMGQIFNIYPFSPHAYLTPIQSYDHPDAVTTAIFHPHKHLIITASFDFFLRVFSIITGTLINSVYVPKLVSTIAISPSVNLLTHYHLSRIDQEGYLTPGPYSNGPSPTSSAPNSSQRKQSNNEGNDGVKRNNRAKPTFKDVSALDPEHFVLDPDEIFLGHYRGQISVYNIQTWSFLQQIEVKNSQGPYRKGTKVTSIELSKDGRMLLASTNDGRIRLMFRDITLTQSEVASDQHDGSNTTTASNTSLQQTTPSQQQQQQQRSNTDLNSTPNSNRPEDKTNNPSGPAGENLQPRRKSLFPSTSTKPEPSTTATATGQQPPTPQNSLLSPSVQQQLMVSCGYGPFYQVRKYRGVKGFKFFIGASFGPHNKSFLIGSEDGNGYIFDINIPYPSLQLIAQRLVEIATVYQGWMRELANNNGDGKTSGKNPQLNQSSQAGKKYHESKSITSTSSPSLTPTPPDSRLKSYEVDTLITTQHDYNNANAMMTQSAAIAFALLPTQSSLDTSQNVTTHLDPTDKFDVVHSWEAQYNAQQQRQQQQQPSLKGEECCYQAAMLVPSPVLLGRVNTTAYNSKPRQINTSLVKPMNSIVVNSTFESTMMQDKGDDNKGGKENTKDKGEKDKKNFFSRLFSNHDGDNDHNNDKARRGSKHQLQPENESLNALKQVHYDPVSRTGPVSMVVSRGKTPKELEKLEKEFMKLQRTVEKKVQDKMKELHKKIADKEKEIDKKKIDHDKDFDKFKAKQQKEIASLEKKLVSDEADIAKVSNYINSKASSMSSNDFAKQQTKLSAYSQQQTNHHNQIITLNNSISRAHDVKREHIEANNAALADYQMQQLEETTQYRFDKMNLLIEFNKHNGTSFGQNADPVSLTANSADLLDGPRHGNSMTRKSLNSRDYDDFDGGSGAQTGLFGNNDKQNNNSISDNNNNNNNSISDNKTSFRKQPQQSDGDNTGDANPVYDAPWAIRNPHTTQTSRGVVIAGYNDTTANFDLPSIVRSNRSDSFHLSRSRGSGEFPTTQPHSINNTRNQPGDVTSHNSDSFHSAFNNTTADGLQRNDNDNDDVKTNSSSDLSFRSAKTPTEVGINNLPLLPGAEFPSIVHGDEQQQQDNGGLLLLDDVGSGGGLSLDDNIIIQTNLTEELLDLQLQQQKELFRQNHYDPRNDQNEMDRYQFQRAQSWSHNTTITPPQSRCPGGSSSSLNGFSTDPDNHVLTVVSFVPLAAMLHSRTGIDKKALEKYQQHHRSPFCRLSEMFDPRQQQHDKNNNNNRNAEDLHFNLNPYGDDDDDDNNNNNNHTPAATNHDKASDQVKTKSLNNETHPVIPMLVCDVNGCLSFIVRKK